MADAPNRTDWYEVLSLPDDASSADIAVAAERRRTILFGRLKNAAGDDHQRLVTALLRIDEAERVLSDPAARAALDTDLRGPGWTPPSEVADARAQAHRPAGPEHQAEARADQPRNEPWLERARHDLACGRFADAVDAGERATAAAAFDWQPHATLARARAGCGQYPEAVNDFDQAIKLNSGNAELHYERGCVLEKMGLIIDAERSYAVAIDADPAQPLYRAAAGRAAHHQQRYADAVHLLESAFAAEPMTQTYREWLADALVNRALDFWTKRPNDQYVPTTSAQRRAARPLLERAASIGVHDQELAQRIQTALRLARGY